MREGNDELTMRDGGGNEAHFVRREDGSITVRAPAPTYIDGYKLDRWLNPCCCSIDWDDRCPVHGPEGDE